MNDKPTNKLPKDYWRSLDELADTQHFRDFLHREFPKGTGEPLNENNGWSRRSFLTLMGASMALAGLASCRRPVEKIVPHVTRPDAYDPGTPVFYATAMPAGLDAYGLLVRSNDGRPTKIEGNPAHPRTQGRSNVWTQASVLDLYDPDRAQKVTFQKADSDFQSFTAWWQQQFQLLKSGGGSKLAVLCRPFSSPTLARLRDDLKRTFPRASFVAYEPISDENSLAGAELAFGQPLLPVYNIGNADVILSLDSDFLYNETDNIANAFAFADARRVTTPTDTMNRLYAVESVFTVTGAKADHRLRMKSSDIGNFVQALAASLGYGGVPSTNFDLKFLRALADDLAAHRGRTVIIAGRKQPAVVHALVCALNQALGNIGQTVSYVLPQDAELPSVANFATLTAAMKSGAVDTLVILGGNPVYDSPPDLNFAEALKSVPNKIQLSHHFDETSQLVDWHIPQSHYLESWGDCRSIDGTLSPIQPLIAPLYATTSDVELLNLLATGAPAVGFDIVRQTWTRIFPSLTFEQGWRKVLHDGVVPGSASPILTPQVNAGAVQSAQAAIPAGDTNTIELTFLPTNVWDGRFGNNGWLQELPEPMNKFTWDNFALISYRTAEKLGVKSGHMEKAKNADIIKIEVDGHSLEIPIWISPGQADNSIAVGLGYGRSNIGKVANAVGVNAFALTSSRSPWLRSAVNVTKVDGTHLIAQTQEHWTMGGYELGEEKQEARPIIRENTLAAFQAGEGFFPPKPPHPPLVSIYDEHPYAKPPQWGMSIDLNACVGCNACVVACQSENNIPVVGKEGVYRGREMHWIRVDRYYAGSIENPEASLAPIPCMHCENAPCEGVCPVAATVHDTQGLNVMVYNRCIGTRYCSNNCPYKVRRFNFFNYQNDIPVTEKMQKNPEVTIRFRGVMEKCTYCIQRIENTKIVAKRESRPVADLEILTACQQACPTDAIVFGDVLNPQSKVAKFKTVNRDYQMLEELNTKPRTSYLAMLRNPNPELESSAT